MLRRKSRLFLLAALAAAAAFVVLGAAAVWSLGGSSVSEEAAVASEEPTAAPQPTVVNCASMTAPELTGEVNTLLDKERGLLTLFYSDGSGSERAITVRYREAACLEIPALRRVIDHARDVDAHA